MALVTTIFKTHNLPYYLKLLKTNNMTQVKFLIEKDGEDVFAFFPDDNYTHSKTDGLFTCYAHLGQHSSCHIDYAKECKEANYNQYWDLLRELINYGTGKEYNDLVIMNKQEIEYHRQPTERELKFGEGAIHYRDFNLAQTGITKTGDLKKWFIADDGLRYYR